MRSLGPLAHKGVGRLASSTAACRTRLPRPLQGAKAATLALGLVLSGLIFGDAVAGGLAEGPAALGPPGSPRLRAHPPEETYGIMSEHGIDVPLRTAAGGRGGTWEGPGRDWTPPASCHHHHNVIHC